MLSLIKNVHTSILVFTFRHRNKKKQCLYFERELRSNKSIIKLLDLLWHGEDNRCIISIDAAAVNTKLTIHKDRHDEGLMGEITIQKDLVKIITFNPDKFHDFYEEHFFVF